MNVSGGEPVFEVYSPRPRQAQSQPRSFAARIASLDGKVIAQVWDHQYRGDEIFAWIEEALVARFPGVRFVHWREFGSTHSRNEREVVASLPGRFAELGVDAVISGIGA